MRKWTYATAVKAVRNCTGLTRCSALDYLHKQGYVCVDGEWVK